MYTTAQIYTVCMYVCMYSIFGFITNLVTEDRGEY